MNRYLLRVSAITTLMLGVASATLASGIPVIDVAKIMKDEINQGVNLAKYLEMIEQNKSRIEQMKQQYSSMTGSRGLGTILNDPAMRDYLPAEWQQVYSSIQNGGYRGLSGAARAIVDANGLAEACSRAVNEAKIACQRQVAKAAQDKANATAAFDAATKRWDQIQGLMKEISNTDDPKAIAELQARIDAEQAAIQNEQTKLQLFSMLAQAEDKLIEQRQRQVNAQNLARRGYVKPAAVQFGD